MGELFRQKLDAGREKVTDLAKKNAVPDVSEELQKIIQTICEL